MEKNIAVIRGDGIGPEIIDATIVVLDAICKKYGHKFNYSYELMGGIATDECGTPLPQKTIDVCSKSDAVLLGSVGGPKWDKMEAHLRPEKGLLGLRNALGLFANIRPALMYDELCSVSPLRADIAQKGIDLVVVRELVGGIYFGERGHRDGKYGDEAYDTEAYSVYEIERIARIAFEMAMTRSKKVSSVDKANVLDTGKLWRATVEKMSKEYPEVEYENVLVDNCAMQLVKNPSQYDVLLCPNMFGDILSDEAAMITGSIGLLPSSSLREGSFGMYEPSHGSAPDIAGKDIANPIATILAGCMMLSSSFGMFEETKAVENAVKTVIANGYRTIDIADENSTVVGCKKMAELIAENI